MELNNKINHKKNKIYYKVNKIQKRSKYEYYYLL